MSVPRLRRPAAVCRLVITLVLLSGFARPAAAAGASISGTATDQLGGPIAQATVTLMRDGRQAATAPTDARGAYTFDGLAEGRYQVDVTAPGFSRQTSDAVFVGDLTGTVHAVNIRDGRRLWTYWPTGTGEELRYDTLGRLVYRKVANEEATRITYDIMDDPTEKKDVPATPQSHLHQ